MDRKRQAVQTCWLGSRQPARRTGNKALKFSDESWADGLRLAGRPGVHYELVTAPIRWTLIN